MKLEQIFNYFNTPSDQGLVISSYCLDGKCYLFVKALGKVFVLGKPY